MSPIPHRLYLMLAIAGALLMAFGPTYFWIDSNDIIIRLTWSSVLGFILIAVGLKGWAMHKRAALARDAEIDVPEFLK